MRYAVPLSLLLVCSTARAGDLPAPLRGVGFDQKLDSQVPLDVPFRDEAGDAVRLGDYFDGKPVILVLAYYRCPMLCTQVLNGLLDGLERMPYTAGDQFTVVVVSFDPHDSPQIAAAKKANYLRHYGRSGATSGWHFLTGEQAAIDRLTRAVGFRYRYDASMDQYAHPAGIMVLTPRGKIARYHFGVKFAPEDLRLSLVEASANRIGTVTDQALLFCFQYDENTGRYTLQIMRLVRLLGALTAFGLGATLVVMWRRERRRAA